MIENQTKDTIFKLVQDYLKTKTLIIWGSGATIPYGMPSMSDLKDYLGITEGGNLEDILSSIEEGDIRTKYEQGIFKKINETDLQVRNEFKNNNCLFEPIKDLISYFYKAYPRQVNIVTTNYDCILEYAFSFYDMPFSDGFTGKEFSNFLVTRFRDKEQINLYKVHGSLRWDNKKYSYFNENMNAIYPNKYKFEKALLNEPFRTLIQRSDTAIENADSFLVIGFGFNDAHLTPRLQEAIDEGKKIVIITRTATETCKNLLSNSKKFVLIEKSEQEHSTLFTYQTKDEKLTVNLEGEFWEIKNFNELLGAANE